MEHELGVRCVAAPIRDHTGAVIASLSISGPATRIRETDVPRLAEGVKETARKLSLQLGHRS
jgi:IclR family acetate operon transcriptional repressor